MGTAVRASDLHDIHAVIDVAKSRGLPIPPDLHHEMCVRETLARGQFPWPTFRSYVEYVNPTLFQFEHIDRLVSIAEDVVVGSILRLMVLLPTRYLKTEVFGRLLCSYFMRRFPYNLVGLASYSASRAWEVSEDARAYFTLTGGRLRESAAAKKFWGPPEGGELWAVGTEEGVIGRGMHLGVCDDPIDPEKALSPVHQRRFQRWWPNKWLSRQEPGARIVLDMQRLGVDDPIDFLFRREVGDNTETAPEHWHVLVMDEIKSDEPLGRWDGPQGLPPTCTLINDTRKVGQVLAPSRFTAKEVHRLQRTAGPVTAASQRQQRPMRPTGDFWKQTWFRTYDTLPSDAFNGGYDWDTAYTKEQGNAASAHVQSYRGPGKPDEFPIYIDGCWWDWLEFPELVSTMQDFGGPHYIEQKASGKSAAQSLRVYGVVAEEVLVPGDKLMRASAVQPAVARGRVYVNKRIVELLLMAEGQGLMRITAEALQADLGGLDLNDAFVQALHRHIGIGAKRKPRALFA